MKILVTYATRHGSTAGIAERIGQGLTEAGMDVEVLPVGNVLNVQRFDAFIIGSAAYVSHWLKDASAFVREHYLLFKERPTWIFSSGPLGTDRVDEKGRDVLDVTRPDEFEEFAPLITPRGTAVFFGAWDPSQPPVGLAERFMRVMPGAHKALPEGDFRDWVAIDAWTATIAAGLRAELHAQVA